MIKHETAQSFPLSSVLFLAILSGLAVGIMSVGFMASFESRGITYLLVGLLGLVVFGPIAQRILQHSLDLAEPGIWFVLFYFAHFGVRAIYDLVFGSPILGFGPGMSDFGAVNAALGVSIIGLLAFWIGYHAHLGKAIARSLPILPRKWSGVSALQIAFLCIVFGWSLRIFLMVSQAEGIGAWLSANKYVELAQAQGTVYLSILSSLATVGLLIIFIMARIRRNRGYWLLFGLFIMPELAFSFVSGSRGQFFFLLLGLLIGLYMTSNRGHKVSMRYVRQVIVLVLLLIVLFPLFSVIRGGVGNLGTTLSRTSNFWKNPTALFHLVEGRQYGLDSLVLVINRASKDENYTLGSELSLVAVAWIPRAIWPDKPIISVGKIFYKKFFPPIYNKGTAAAVTLPGEFYWDLGLGGVIMGMLLIGVLWRFLFEYLVRPKGNLSNILVVSSMFLLFFGAVEQTLVSLLTMHLFQFLVVAFITLGIRGRMVEMKVCQ